MKRNKALLITVMIFLLNQGCSTSPIESVQGVGNSQCPDLSGVYKGMGQYNKKGVSPRTEKPVLQEGLGFVITILAANTQPSYGLRLQYKDENKVMNELYDNNYALNDFYLKVVRTGITNYRTEIYRYKDHGLQMSYRSDFPVESCQNNKIVYKYKMNGSITDDMIPVIKRINRQVTLYVDVSGNLHNDFIEKSYSIPFFLLIPVWFKTSKYTENIMAEKYMP